MMLESKLEQLKSIFKPLRPSISVKEMKQEQDYQPIKKNAFYKKAALSSLPKLKEFFGPVELD